MYRGDLVSRSPKSLVELVPGFVDSQSVVVGQRGGQTGGWWVVVKLSYSLIWPPRWKILFGVSHMLP